MKKLLFILLLVYFSSCQSKHDEFLIQDQVSDELKSASAFDPVFKAQTYDKFVVKFAKSLSKSLEDKSIRQLIKEDAIRQEDGDYDIIWKTFKDKVSGINGKKVSQIISENIEGSKNDEKLIELELFSSEFKKFQISVPVNCEKWNVNDQYPVVAYMLSDYDDKDENINAFDENGKKITLSMKSIPDFPVIVVSLNERCNEEGEFRKEYVRLKSISLITLNPPTNLIANQVPSGIYLIWNAPSIIDGVCGYVVERKGPADNDFFTISHVFDPYNLAYTDITVSRDETYSYRIKSYSDASSNEITSSGSNIAFATAPSAPTAPTSFTVEHVVQSESKLNWINTNSQLITENRIYRYSYSAGSNYDLIATLPASSSYYFDRNVAPGKYEYLIKHVNNQGESSGIKDFVHIPYRNIQGTNPIYVKNISFTNWDLERWPAGKPEFRINVFNVNRQTHSTINVVSNADFNFPDIASSHNFSNGLLVNWNQDIWYDVLSLSMVEYDEQWFAHKLTVSASIKSKVADALEVGVGAALEWDLTDDFENCGIVYIDFYEQPEITYWFSNYGASITISGLPN